MQLCTLQTSTYVKGNTRLFRLFLCLLWWPSCSSTHPVQCLQLKWQVGPPINGHRWNLSNLCLGVESKGCASNYILSFLYFCSLVCLRLDQWLQPWVASVQDGFSPSSLHTHTSVRCQQWHCPRGSWAHCLQSPLHENTCVVLSYIWVQTCCIHY